MGMGSGGGEAVTMATDGLRERLLSKPESVKFEETMQVIADAFDYTPKRFVRFFGKVWTCGLRGETV